MKRKVIRNWKVIISNCSLSNAIKLISRNNFDGVSYDRIGIGRNKNCIIENFDINNKEFSSKDILYDDWCIFIPDDGMEALTNKLRNIVKEEHFSGLNYNKIDNMSIDELWEHIRDWKLDKLDLNSKYRLIKFIIENKLYKNT